MFAVVNCWPLRDTLTGTDVDKDARPAANQTKQVWWRTKWDAQGTGWLALLVECMAD